MMQLFFKLSRYVSSDSTVLGGTTSKLHMEETQGMYVKNGEDEPDSVKLGNPRMQEAWW